MGKYPNGDWKIDRDISILNRDICISNSDISMYALYSDISIRNRDRCIRNTDNYISNAETSLRMI